MLYRKEYNFSIISLSALKSRIRKSSIDLMKKKSISFRADALNLYTADNGNRTPGMNK